MLALIATLTPNRTYISILAPETTLNRCKYGICVFK